ncbi:transposase, partial [Colletotrichum graminicola M1.001]
RSELIFLTRDKNSRQGGYTTNRYIQTLDEGFLPVYDDFRHFVQDNAPIHTSAQTLSWLRSHGVSWLDWPPYSPDLNPIKHI